MSYPIVIRFIFGLLGFIVSYQLYSKYGAVKTGDPAFGMLKFKDWIHIHHWLWSSILIAVLFFLNIRDLLLYGFLIGSIIQGLTYKDWYIIIYRKDKFHEIYSKFR